MFYVITKHDRTRRRQLLIIESKVKETHSEAQRPDKGPQKLLSSPTVTYYIIVLFKKAINKNTMQIRNDISKTRVALSTKDNAKI